MDWQILINIGLGAIIAVVGWFSREIWDSLKELRRDLHNIETNLPQIYVRRDELKEVRQEINARFDKLESMMSQFFDRLNDKADK
jgi:acyl carrier protein phosphodiesterase